MDMSRIKRALLPVAILLLAMVTFVGVTVQDGAAIALPTASNSNGHVHPGHTTTATPTPTTIPADTSEPGSRPRTPEELLRRLGERIVAKDVEGVVALHEPDAALVNYDLSIIRGHQQIRKFYVDWFKSDPVLTVNPLQVLVTGGQPGRHGKVLNRTASIMGNYSLEQTAPDGSRESFTGNFCDVVRQQPNGTWLYLQDNPYPPHHGLAASASLMIGRLNGELAAKTRGFDTPPLKAYDVIPPGIGLRHWPLWRVID
jgi:ketosteroid isomerase-like protein